MRLALLAAVACLAATPTLAQPADRAYLAGGHACQAVILLASAKNSSGPINFSPIAAEAGFSRATSHPAKLDGIFFADGGAVDWYRAGSVYIGFNADKAKCLTFLMDRKAGDLNRRFLAEVGEGWQSPGQDQFTRLVLGHHLMVSEAYDAQGATGKAGSLGGYIDIHYFP